MARIVVVGGGISGLSIAYSLKQQRPADEIVLLEQHSRLGGCIGTLRREGFTVERGPNGFLDNNPVTKDLVSDLGLQNQLLAASEVAGRNRFLMLDGRLKLLPNSLLSLMSSDLLSLAAKLQLLTEQFRPPQRHVPDESIYSFARRRVGHEIAFTFVDAFVTGILAGDPKLLSIQAAFPRLARFEREYGSILRGMAQSRKAMKRQTAPQPSSRPSLTVRQRLAQLFQKKEAAPRARMWSFNDGLTVLVDGLAEHLRGMTHTGVNVRRILRENNGWTVEAEGKDRRSADVVILACPAYRQAEMLSDLDEDLAATIAGIPYNRIAVVALGYHRGDVRHSLEGFGYLSPQRTRRDVLGMQWCSSIFPGTVRAPEGMVLLRALCGGWHRADIVDWPDDRLIEAVRAELNQIMGVKVPPAFVEIIRWSKAIPQYLIGHLERLTWIDDRLKNYPGLFVGGNAYRGVAINDCVEQGRTMANRVASWLSVRL